MISYLGTVQFWAEYQAALNTWPVDLGPAVTAWIVLTEDILSEWQYG